MIPSSTFRALLATLELIGVALFASPTAALNTIGGRIQPVPQDRWAGHGAFNNQNCWKQFDGEGCEDVVLHEASSTAFLACGNLDDRAQWYPPSGPADRNSSKTYLEYFLKYDLEANQTTRLEIENWNPTQDLVLHGIDMRLSDDNPNEIQLFAINHDRQGESIAVFTHTLGSSTLQFVKQYSSSLLVSVNAVAAAGPKSFFASNDHYFYNGTGRAFENEFGPFMWATSIVYCEEIMDTLGCRVVSPDNSHPGANGIRLIDGGQILAVNDAILATTTLYAVDPITKVLERNRTIGLGAGPDNVFVMPDSGDLIVAVVPDGAALGVRFADGLNTTGAPVEGAILRLAKANNYAPELLFWDDGSLLSLITAGVVDARLNKLVAGGVYARNWIVCDINM